MNDEDNGYGYKQHWLYDAVEWILDRPSYILGLINYTFRPWLLIAQLKKDNSSLLSRLGEVLKQESEAGKNGLRLYAENEELRKYKALAEGQMTQFVPQDDYDMVVRERDRYKSSAERVATINENMLKDWLRI